MARVVEATESRVRPERRTDGVFLAVPRESPWWRYFAVAWCSAFVVLGIYMVAFGGDRNAANIAFMVVWTLLATGITATWVWRLFHAEELLLDSQQLTHTRRLGPVRRARAYRRDQIRDVRVSTGGAATSSWRGPFGASDAGGGIVAFDYGGRTIRFADAEEAEAKRLVEALRAEGLTA